MDTADALFSRAAPEKRLQILKDPHAGSFAVITLLLVFLLQGASVCTILQQPACWPGWLLIPLLSRACVSVLILLAPDILTDGLARIPRKKQCQATF
jgi:adenosylcobinamide-GDP ribazoletransferase